MTSNECNVDGIWAAFHWSAIIFYGGYGILCWFVPEWYGKTIYFRNRWNLENDFHSTDKIFYYFVIGAGECCVHMSLMNYFGMKFGNPSDNDNLSNWLMHLYCIIQILTWVKWTLTEAYYTYKDVEWPPIGCVHVMLCIIVLALSIQQYVEVSENCL